ncbi:MAG: type IV secretion protein Dot [Gammaproteobacteria bacterium]|nr:type IV secretion protein Dot [Gammaproteobacteria bacterium]
MPNEHAQTEQVVLAKPPKALSSILAQWLKNGWRTLISPLTQVIMAVGIFPAQTLSTIKKIPLLSSMVGFITRKLGNDSRLATETFQEDFVEKKVPVDRVGFFGVIWNFFNKNAKAIPFVDGPDLKVAAVKTPYTTDFGRHVELETYHFEHNDFEKIPTEHQYYRVHCGNNTANCSRFFTELATLSQRHPELKTIAYNHPGIEGSGGVTMSQDDLINGLCAQVKLLIQNGAKPENIELSGFSIGAATAALAAEKLYQEGFNVKLDNKNGPSLFDDRTFSTMGDVVTNGFPVLGGVFKALKMLPIVKELTHYILQPLVKNLVVKPLLWLINWNMDPARAYNSVSPARRALTVVKPESKGDGALKTIGKYIGKFTGLFKRGTGDKVIPFHVSLLSGTENTADKAAWKKTLSELEQDIKDNEGVITKPELLDALKPDNSISSDALVRLKLATVRHENASDLVCLLKVGTKARRFHGVAEANAHNNRSEELVSRVKPEEMQAALRAAKLDPALPANGVTFYSLHHKAVQAHNEREEYVRNEFKA